MFSIVEEASCYGFLLLNRHGFLSLQNPLTLIDASKRIDLNGFCFGALIEMLAQKGQISSSLVSNPNLSVLMKHASAPDPVTERPSYTSDLPFGTIHISHVRIIVH